MASKTLKALLQHVLATQFDGVQATLADAIGIDKTHMGRVIRGVATTLSVESALALARTCDLDPDEVLTAAGKGDIAATIRHLYGKAAPVRGTLTEEERTWLAALRGLPGEHRKAVLSVAKGLARD